MSDSAEGIDPTWLKCPNCFVDGSGTFTEGVTRQFRWHDGSVGTNNHCQSCGTELIEFEPDRTSISSIQSDGVSSKDTVQCQYCDFTGTGEEVLSHLLALVAVPITVHRQHSAAELHDKYVDEEADLDGE